MKSTLLLFTLLLFSLSSCQYARYVYYNFPGIEDHDIFPYREIDAPEDKYIFKISEQNKKFDSITMIDDDDEKIKFTFDEYLIENETVAFIVIKNDSIIYENYFDDYTESSIINPFSVSKSITSILIGCAIDDGLIKSEEDYITDYLPELKENGFEKMKISHLLDMRSGIEFTEVYGPTGTVAAYYYGTDLKDEISELRLEMEPGTETYYKSCDTQMLGLLLQRVLDGKSVSEYLEERIWKPLGMEYPARWSLDEDDGLEKTFCCMNARAIDLAKIGRLYLNNGNWNGKQIVSEEWVKKSTSKDERLGEDWTYKNQWWLQDNGAYMAQGILGQFIYVSPKSDMVIVRIGHDYGDYSNWKYTFEMIEYQCY